VKATARSRSICSSWPMSGCAAMSVKGKRYNRETLQVKYKGKTIADVLDMDVQTALEFFANVPRVRRILQTLHDVGLDYIKLGQPATTLSGGEAQRVKLSRELASASRPGARSTFSMSRLPACTSPMCRTCLRVLHRLRRCRQHRHRDRTQPGCHQDRRLDHRYGARRRRRRWVVVASGTPEEVAGNVSASHTGHFLHELLFPAAQRAAAD
jgi:excinuclease ABC subunit A